MDSRATAYTRRSMPDWMGVGRGKGVKMTQKSGFEQTWEDRALGKHGTRCSTSTWKQISNQKSNVNICLKIDMLFLKV